MNIDYKRLLKATGIVAFALALSTFILLVSGMAYN